MGKWTQSQLPSDDGFQEGPWWPRSGTLQDRDSIPLAGSTVAGADFPLELLQCLLHVLPHCAGIGEIRGCHQLIQRLRLGRRKAFTLREDIHHIEVQSKVTQEWAEGQGREIASRLLQNWTDATAHKWRPDLSLPPCCPICAHEFIQVLANKH